jgi:hypothetical protein
MKKNEKSNGGPHYLLINVVQGNLSHFISEATHAIYKKYKRSK